MRLESRNGLQKSSTGPVALENVLGAVFLHVFVCVVNLSYFNFAIVRLQYVG